MLEKKIQGLLHTKGQSAIPHNASGEISPRVFKSKLSRLLTALNALADVASSPYSDLESILSYILAMDEEQYSAIKQRGEKRFGCIHRNNGAKRSVELRGKCS